MDYTVHCTGNKYCNIIISLRLTNNFNRRCNFPNRRSLNFQGIFYKITMENEENLGIKMCKIYAFYSNNFWWFLCLIRFICSEGMNCWNFNIIVSENVCLFVMKLCLSSWLIFTIFIIWLFYYLCYRITYQ